MTLVYGFDESTPMELDIVTDITGLTEEELRTLPYLQFEEIDEYAHLYSDDNLPDEIDYFNDLLS